MAAINTVAAGILCSKAPLHKSMSRRQGHSRENGARRIVRCESENNQRKAGEPSARAKLRAEAQSPFGTARSFLFGGFVLSGTIGTITELGRLIGILAHAPNASTTLGESLKSLAIDAGAAALFAYLYVREQKLFEKRAQKADREESLADLRIETAKGNTRTLYRLRGRARPVVVAGQLTFVQDAIAAARPYSEGLREKGVVVVPVVLDKIGNAAKEPDRDVNEGIDIEKLTCRPLMKNSWASWFRIQKSTANIEDQTGVYVGLRMDGRIRMSGARIPNWERIALSLPPVDVTGTFLDGFDGAVRPFE